MAEEAKQETESKREEVQQVAAVKQTNRPMIIAIIIASVAAVLVIVVIAAALAIGVANRHAYREGLTNARGGTSSQQETPARHADGMYGMRGNQANSDTFVSGVVTAVNGDTITVSGNGKQTTVTKNGSTTIRGTATTVAVNDSVAITGTTTNGTFTATTITIRNL